MAPPSNPERRRATAPSTLLAAVVLAGALLGGCGSAEEPDPALERGPAPPDGSIISSRATLRAGGDFETLAGAVNRSRGVGEALIVGVAVVDRGEPTLRLLVDGEPVDAGTQDFSGGGGTVSTISCSCKLPVGDSDITLEGKGGSGAVVGARTLMVFTPAHSDEIPASDLVDTAGIEDSRIAVNPDGTGMASTELRSDADHLVVLAAYRSPDETSASPQAIRTEALVGGAAIPEVASTSIPDGRLAVYYSAHGAQAGDAIELVGYTVTGSAHVHATMLAVCPCGLD